MATPSAPTKIDPVCGMPVAPGAGQLSTEFRGQQFWFCSPQCQERFQADPERFGTDQPTQSADASAKEIDPVCGMEVEPAAAAAVAIHGGRHFYFCSTTCHERFLGAPARFSEMHSLQLARTKSDFPIDPICGMSVDPANPGATLELPEGTMYFCCQPCADEYAAAGTASI